PLELFTILRKDSRQAGVTEYEELMTGLPGHLPPVKPEKGNDERWRAMTRRWYFRTKRNILQRL
ncbi:MAG TPA: hypothetical protein DEP99_00595, partial [Nitrospiraceae bacterium]|nr:hypothetical protein [Nitrospiraceae bacterium]